VASVVLVMGTAGNTTYDAHGKPQNNGTSLSRGFRIHRKALQKKGSFSWTQ